MSYARWSDGNWYAYPAVNDSKELDKQLLALYHCKIEGGGCWSYAKIKDADENWVADKFSGVSEDDVIEALDIIASFRFEMESKFDES